MPDTLAGDAVPAGIITGAGCFAGTLRSTVRRMDAKRPMPQPLVDHSGAAEKVSAQVFALFVDFSMRVGPKSSPVFVCH